MQEELLTAPEAGVVSPGSSGLRKLRFGSAAAGRGKRGGLRVVDDWWEAGAQIWLFAIYAPSTQDDLDPRQTRVIRTLLAAKLAERRRR